MAAAGLSSPVSPTPARRPARELLLEAAARLFYANGVAATGIDTITAEAGVAKKSLYNNFSSKADLVAAYLEARHGEWLGLYRKRLATAPTPRSQVLAVFDAYLDHANFAYQYGFRGCGLLNAAAELPAGHPGRDAVRRHKEEVQELLARHVSPLLQGREEQVSAVAAHLAFLLEGAMARAGLEGNDGPLKDARRMAGQLLDAL
ncbi:TetR/AcrR family transcriptional regulator [Arthrobacter sp. NicSoilC5]|uniref:TetR/AcrR family transcriptional regulator n=1 Tax=Arthrobacter sp. NicSoilC5 TaxID=2831000 RepID=UPI001CC71802|nr:TetR/AcrR family transcriptional regulator [Arthrobacter sp. NicSoilC5]BCW81149.1 TetR family transcriptional regulator [Arthrobacter sp. NicSoilC5]